MIVVAVGPPQWRRWRALRLRALAGDPDAFGSTFAAWWDADESRWRARLSMPGALDLIAVDPADGRDVGMVTGVPNGSDDVELISMWVDPAVRGHGVAGRLIGDVAAWAARRGRGLRLAVRPDNHAAIRAYVRRGFEPTEEPGDPVPGGGHELIMVWHSGPE